jgi:hypothetical protein
MAALFFSLLSTVSVLNSTRGPSCSFPDPYLPENALTAPKAVAAAAASDTERSIEHVPPYPSPGTKRLGGSAPDGSDPSNISVSQVSEPVVQSEKDDPRPHLVWLMSFPNSGTTFTINMVREESNTSTATNYGFESKIDGVPIPSVQAIPGPIGMNGPFLKILENRTTTLPSTILTKNHCVGYCNGETCTADETVHTIRSFMAGCFVSHRIVHNSDGSLGTEIVSYAHTLVKKAIHLLRHPLDNIVSRFHHKHAAQLNLGNTEYDKMYPKNVTGFHKWCAAEDAHDHIINSRFLIVDHRLKEKMINIPCMNEFFRYVQWHNLAFAVSREMGLSTMILHYHEYADNFEKTRDKVLDWLELPRVGEGMAFHLGKVYRHYYSDKQKRAIWEFLEEFSSLETWAELKDYNFKLEPNSTVS